MKCQALFSGQNKNIIILSYTDDDLVFDMPSFNII